ncbi:MAG: hypothetical protein HY063_02400 [Bacteroidetes bacterium]|nr:hypothetical protein [Bacteroidota bacterium]
MKKLFLSSVIAITILSAAQNIIAQGTWVASGNNIVYTMRNVGINTASPAAPLDVNGLINSLSMKAQNANFATAVVTGNFSAGSLNVSGNAAVNGSLSVASGQFSVGNISVNGTPANSSITSSSGIINFASNNLTTGGTISSTNISSLQNEADTNTSHISNLQSAISNIHSSQWSSNPDGSISFNGNVFVKNLGVANAVSIGSFRFSNGSNQIQPIITDSIRTPYAMALSSGGQKISLNADSVSVGNSVRVDNGQLNVAGNISASGNISSGTLTAGSIVTSQLTIDTLHALSRVAVNHSLLLTKATANNYAEVSTTSSNVDLVLQGDSAKRVGIGTTSPTEKLTVQGNGKFSGNVTANCVNANCLHVAGQTQFDSVKVGSKIQLGNSLNIYGSGSSSGFYNMLFTDLSQFSNPDPNLYIQSIPGTPPITSLGPAPFNTILNFNSVGNVGIGKDNPQEKLDVTGNGKFSGTIDAANYLKNGQPFAGEWITASNGTDVYNTNSGHVGIGTNNPVRELHVYTEHVIPNPPPCPPSCFAGTHNGMRLEDKTTIGSAPPVITAYDIAPINGTLYISKADLSDPHKIDEKLVIQSNGFVGIGHGTPQAELDVKGSGLFSGNVGIGTTTPLAKLDVRGGNALFSGSVGIGITNPQGCMNVVCPIPVAQDAKHQIFTAENAQVGSPYFSVLNDGSVEASGTINAANYLKNGKSFAGEWVTAANGKDIYNTNSGNVGIGTSAPQAPLHIYGSGDQFIDISSSSGSSYTRLLAVTSNSKTESQLQYKGTFGIYELGGTVKLFIDGSGNVICDHLFTKVLDVAPDYVFEKEYPLMPLEEVEKYKDKFKHLPDVPSAKEFEKNGMSVGDFSLVLLKKIEELSLYTIELQKQNKAMEERIVKLEKGK